MGKRLVLISVMVGLIAGMPTPVSARGEPQESARETRGSGKESGRSVAEGAALIATSAAVSAAQVPPRAGTCEATFVVAGLAYLLTVFDREARQGPARAIGRVCGGPYVTTPKDLRGR
ncbi:MAG: hypothetical protein ACE5IQ_00685 [Candidatus Methylomirabilales bacterium]